MVVKQAVQKMPQLKVNCLWQNGPIQWRN